MAEKKSAKSKQKKLLFIIGEINEGTTTEVLNELMTEDWSKDKSLDIYIVSEGGYLRDCFAIIDIIQDIKVKHKITINTFGLGEIASAGFFIFLLGDNRYLYSKCRVFVHEHITVGGDKTYGEQLKADRTEEREAYNNYVDYTAKQLGLSIQKAKNLLRKNKWLTQKEISMYKINTTEVQKCLT